MVCGWVAHPPARKHVACWLLLFFFFWGVAFPPPPPAVHDNPAGCIPRDVYLARYTSRGIPPVGLALLGVLALLAHLVALLGDPVGRPDARVAAAAARRGGGAPRRRRRRRQHDERALRSRSVVATADERGNTRGTGRGVESVEFGDLPRACARRCSACAWWCRCWCPRSTWRCSRSSTTRRRPRGARRHGARTPQHTHAHARANTAWKRQNPNTDRRSSSAAAGRATRSLRAGRPNAPVSKAECHSALKPSWCRSRLVRTSLRK